MKRLILCVGLPRSASTWLFNAAAEIERSVAPKKKIAAFYADDFHDEAEAALVGADIGVVKSHIPGSSLRVFAAQLEMPVLLSVRDPHDAVVSSMQRFSHDFAGALNFVAPSCDAILRLLPVCEPFTLKYEDGFSSGPAGLRKIAAFLERDLTPGAIRRISAKLSPRAIAAFIEDLAQKGEFGDQPVSTKWHGPTHWHYDHLGDGAVGKYRDLLSVEEIAAVSERTRDFCERFGYETSSGGAR